MTLSVQPHNRLHAQAVCSEQREVGAGGTHGIVPKVRRPLAGLKTWTRSHKHLLQS